MRERDHLEDPNLDGFLRSGMGRHGLDHCNSGYEQMTDAYKCGNEISGSIKCGEFFEYLRTG
jgi:hypothetical protein